MKILHISTAISWRGGEQQIAYLVEELKMLGQTQWILCPKDSVMEQYCKDNGIEYFSYKKIFALNPVPAFIIKNICRKKKIDIIHVHDSHAHSFAIMSSTLFRNKTQVIISRRVDFAVGKNFFSRRKYNHSAVWKIICVSSAIKEVLKPVIKNNETLVVVHDGVDLKRFPYDNTMKLHREYDIPEEVPIIGNIAAIAAHKDYITFVNTVEEFKKVYKKPIRFFIIGGDGGKKNEIEKYISEKNLENDIILTGFRNDIPKVLPELNILLFTSKEEGLGTSILDAFICGIPVVATNAGGISEIVLHNKTGLLAEIKDANTLAAHLTDVLETQGLKEKLADNAKEFVQRFSKKEMAQKTLAIYNETFKKN